MRNRKIYIFVLFVLVFLAFYGVLRPTMAMGHSMPDSMECFGSKCGPVEHITMHMYNLPSEEYIVIYTDESSLFVDNQRELLGFLDRLEQPPKAVSYI